MPKILPALFLILIPYFLLNFSSANAHFEENTTEVDINLHIDPDDDPVAGEPSFFYFEVTDPQGLITAETCNCIISVSKEGKILKQSGLFAVNKTPGFNGNPSLTYVFPSKGVYKIMLEAEASGNQNFEKMEFVYNLRITRQSEKNSGFISNFSESLSSKNVKITAIYISLILAFLGFIIVKRKLRR